MAHEWRYSELPELPPDEPAPPRRGLSILGFPLRVDPFFFVTAWLIGGSREPLWTLAWVAVVLVGVLAHELGHAFAGRRLGLEPWIRLFAFGGMTGWGRPRPLSARQQIAISFAGPAVGLAIGGLVLLGGLSGALAGAPPPLARVLTDVLWVNLGWGVLNLLPILPLDGGHIVSSAAEMAAGRRGRLAARAFSVVLTVVIGLWALSAGQWWILILCAVFAFTNVQALRVELGQS
jgi:membrane-associated protease RseP (regulator of RpoE activity)